MTDTAPVTQIYGNAAVLKKCIADEKFAYVVALARAINALISAHSLMMIAKKRNTPDAIRDGMNSYFFASALLYESLRLIRAMSKVFTGDNSYETSLRLILQDPSGQKLEEMHLKALRHGGMFHFLPDRFAEAINKTGMTDCVFASTIGTKVADVHYAFADNIAAEMMVGERLDNAVVVPQMMERTLELVKQFIEHSEIFIARQLNGWGFEILPVAPASPEK